MLYNIFDLSSPLKKLKQGNSTVTGPYEIHLEFFLPNGNLTTDQNSVITYVSIKCALISLSVCESYYLPSRSLMQFTRTESMIITFWQYSSHTWLPGGGGVSYYGLEATLDVYGFDLEHGQASAAAIWIVNRGDGQPSSLSAIQFGWHVSYMIWRAKPIFILLHQIHNRLCIWVLLHMLCITPKITF
jgi:hypothetical protein